MCARYYMGEDGELGSFIAEMSRSPLAAAIPPGTPVARGGEVRPGTVAPAKAMTRAFDPKVFPMRWGFTGRMRLINARTESAAVRLTFREAWHAHRCALPASGYYEWEHFTDERGRERTGTKYFIRPENARVTWLCGLYRMEAGLPCFVVLTREPGESVRFIHDRMPLILPEEAVARWIDPRSDPGPLLDLALTDMACERVS